MTKSVVDTIVHLTAIAADSDPALGNLKWIPETYDCAQAVVAAAKGEEPNYEDCVAALVRRKELKTGPAARWEAVNDGLKVMVEQAKSLLDGVVKTEQQRLAAEHIVETQLAAIDSQLAAAEDDFTFQDGVISELQVEAIRVRKRLSQCPALPAKPPVERHLRGRAPLANSINVPPGAPLRAVIAASVLNDPDHAQEVATPAAIADARTVLKTAIKLRDEELALGGVVVELEPAVVVEPRERALLAMRVAERRAKQAALVADAFVLDGDPREERLGVRAQVQVESLARIRLLGDPRVSGTTGTQCVARHAEFPDDEK